MGQKINPNGLRYGVSKNWLSRWNANDDKQTAAWLVQDEKVREYLIKNFKDAQIVETEIERTQATINAIVKCGQPGILLGKEGINIKTISLAINKIVGRNIKVNVTVVPFEAIQMSARVIAREIADAIENRVSFRIAQKMAIRKVMMAKAVGIKTHVSGRLGGVEMAREEGYSEGMIPLSTIKANIDYALEIAHTTYGVIGVKVWINRGKNNGNFVARPKRKFDDKRRPNNRNFNGSKGPNSVVESKENTQEVKKDGE